jgi:hypothetical protein
VRTPAGLRTVRAKQILNTAYPLVSNLNGWDLSAQERRLFGKLSGHSYFASVLRTKGVGQGTVLSNVGTDDPYGCPDMPGAYGLMLPPISAGDTHLLYYGAMDIMSSDTAQANLRADFRRLANAGVVREAKVDILAWYDHTPIKLFATPADIRAGLYRDLSALQGVHSTWWSGAAWQAQDSSLIWEFTSRLVDRMLAA